MEWYYLDDKGERCGPLTDGELRKLIAQGSVGSDALVWHAGMSDWTAAREMGLLPRSIGYTVAAALAWAYLPLATIVVGIGMAGATAGNALAAAFVHGLIPIIFFLVAVFVIRILRRRWPYNLPRVFFLCAVTYVLINMIGPGVLKTAWDIQSPRQTLSKDEATVANFMAEYLRLEQDEESRTLEGASRPALVPENLVSGEGCITERGKISQWRVFFDTYHEYALASIERGWTGIASLDIEPEFRESLLNDWAADGEEVRSALHEQREAVRELLDRREDIVRFMCSRIGRATLHEGGTIYFGTAVEADEYNRLADRIDSAETRVSEVQRQFLSSWGEMRSLGQTRLPPNAPLQRQ